MVSLSHQVSFTEVVELVPLSQPVSFWSVVTNVLSGSPTAFISGQSPRGMFRTGEMISLGSIISARNATSRCSAALSLVTSYCAAQHWGPVFPRQCSIAFAINSSGHPVKEVVGRSLYVSKPQQQHTKTTNVAAQSTPKTDDLRRRSPASHDTERTRNKIRMSTGPRPVQCRQVPFFNIVHDIAAE
jgi:hypothetical protein